MAKKKTLKDMYPKTWGAGGKSPAEAMKPKKKMNALDEAITKGKKLPIKGRKKLPPDYDVIVPGMKKPPKKIKKK